MYDDDVNPHRNVSDTIMTFYTGSFDTNDALYDLAWSEINENQLLVACGDGSIKLFDLGVDTYPVMNYHEHKRETFSVFWNQTTKDTFVSSSWDGTVKIVRLSTTPFYLHATRTYTVNLSLSSCSGLQPETTLSGPFP